MMLQTPERIREVENELSQCLMALLANASNETLNRLMVFFDQLSIEMPRLYCQFRGQNISRALIDITADEFEQRAEEKAA